MSSKNTNTEVYYTLLPTAGRERTYKFWDLLAVQICYGIAAWFFLAGAQTGLYLPAKEAVPTILAGNCIPLFMIVGCGLVASRYGVEQLTSTRGIFGNKGTTLVLWMYLLCLYPSQATLCLLFGQSATKFSGSLFGENLLSSEGFGVTFFGLLALVIGGFIAWLGPNALKWFTRISAICMFAILAGLIVYVLNMYGIDYIFNAEPREPIMIDGEPSAAWSRASALETNVGIGLSWAFFFGQWTRLADSESTAFHGTMWGWGLLAAIAGVFAAFTALATGIYDPTIWLVNISEDTGIPFLSILGLLLMAIANVSSFATATYPATISLRSRFPKLKWVPALMICIIPVLFLLNDDVYNAINKVFSFIACLSSIYGAIVIADLLFVCKGRFSIREMFNYSKGYSYWKGYNPGALVAMAAGLAFYLTTLNPLTWESPNGLFPYISAGIPTFIITGIVYIVRMKCWVLKKFPVTFMNDIKYDDQK